KETLDKLIEELKKIFEKRRTGELIEEIDYGKLNRKDFILLKGDISGIQDFIYSVSSEHALKGLRGRSFYLQLISEIIAYKILDEFNLTKANLIYLGGGNFIILLPNLSDAEKRLEKLTEEIDKVIFKAHQGKLGFLISYIKFPYWNFIENFGDLLSELGRKLAIEKRKKFKYLISENLFKPYPEKVEKEMGGCEICGREIEKKDKCELCESFEKLAIEIKKENVIMEIKKVNKKEIKEEVNKWDEIFEGLGYKISFEKSIGGIKIYLNNSDFLKVNCDAFRYEAIYSPEGTLEDIAKKAEGIERWGALRMDVDNLGLIFGSGFIDEEGKDITTISKYSMLSYTFSLFFSLGIRNIVEKEYKEKCCVVYSGGDDLFIIAPWSDLPEIAEEIWRNFRKYVCNHEKITISGGIYIAPSKKFPVYQAAKKAGEEEEKAKKGEKNKITFFEPIKWDEEFVKIKEVKNKLYELLKEDGKPKVSRAILTILYGGYKEKELKERGKIPFVRIWRIFYALKRFMERHKDYENDIDKIRETFITDFNIQPKLNVAVRWAELLTRKGG
ncbi:MAG TPA: type III-A CRISPR-associated protein Cas10/Csm1, partial [bacterium]|nr:type III-A CRISPR-associated protein Cas10/Csm1 [bacterium]